MSKIKNKRHCPYWKNKTKQNKKGKKKNKKRKEEENKKTVFKYRI